MSSPKQIKPQKISTEAAGKKAVTTAGAVLVLGAVLGAAALMSDPERFAYSYLTGFVWVATIGLGALFFIIVQHLTKAGWSVPRRVMDG